MPNQKPKKYEKLTISFTEADEDIIEYVQKLKDSGKASEFTREAIRDKINRKEINGENNKEIISELQRIEKRISLIEKNISDETNIAYNEDVKTKNDTVIQEEKIEKEEENEDINKIKFDDNVKIDDNLENALDFFDF